MVWLRAQVINTYFAIVILIATINFSNQPYRRSGATPFYPLVEWYTTVEQ